MNLRGKYDRSANRDDALAGVGARASPPTSTPADLTRSICASWTREPEATRGDQFKYVLKKDGSISSVSREALDSSEFLALLDAVEGNLKRMGRAIYAGQAAVDPSRKGATLACDQCDYRAICRIDPWTHVYRLLRKVEAENPARPGDARRKSRQRLGVRTAIPLSQPREGCRRDSGV